MKFYKNNILGSKVAWSGSRELVFKFWDPSITSVRMKLDTLFSLCKIGHSEYYTTDAGSQRGRGQYHVTYFLNINIFCCNKTANINVNNCSL